MRILVNNLPAAIKKDSSFEVNLQSSLFHSDEVFSLNIDFPLSIKENRDIFGTSVGFEGFNDLVYPCSISEGSFQLSGYLKVLSLQDNILSGQFIQDFVVNMISGLNSLYMDEIELGCVCDMFNVNDFSQLNLSFENQTINGNNMSTYGIQMLKVKSDGTIYGSFKNESDVKMAPIFQLYLWKLLDILSLKLGYTFSFPPINGFDHILIGNVFVPRLRASVSKDEDFRNFMPHWTIGEFVSNLSKLFGCNVSIDHGHKTITFSKINGNNLVTKDISRDIILDDFTIETLDNNIDYKGIKGLKFTFENEDGELNSCEGAFQVGGYCRSVHVSQLLTELHSYASTPYEGLRSFNTNHYLYIIPLGYACYRKKEIPTSANSGTLQSRLILEVGMLNQQYVDGYDEYEELPFIPVTINRWYDQHMVWEDTKRVAALYSYEINEIITDEANNETNTTIDPSKDYFTLAKEYKVNDTKYSSMYLCMYGPESIYSTYKIPNICKYEPLSFCLIFGNDPEIPQDPWFHPYTKLINQYSYFFDIKNWQVLNLPQIDMSRKYTLNILTEDTITPNSIFRIEGHSYICKNIKIDVSESGVSAKKELELYRIYESSSSSSQSSASRRRSPRRIISASGSGSGSGDIAE